MYKDCIILVHFVFGKDVVHPLLLLIFKTYTDGGKIHSKQGKIDLATHNLHVTSFVLLTCSKVARAGKDPVTLVCPIARFHGRAKLWMTMVDMNISDDFQVHLSMENCMCKFFVPPSCLQKKLLFGEETRVAALGLVSLLILVSFGDLLVLVSLQPQFH